MRFWLGLLPFLASIAVATPAWAFCRLTTQSPSTSQAPRSACVEGGEPLAWRQRCISYTLVPSDQLDLDVETVRSILEVSFAAWTNLQCQPGQALPVVLGQTEELGACTLAEYNRFGPNANTIAFVPDWSSRGEDYLAEAYGLTLVWHDPETGEILDADIQINLHRGTGTVVACGEQCTGDHDVDLQNVLTHEAGHFLGLAHSANRDATMYGDAPFSQTSKRTLEVDDVAGMCAIYGMLEQPVCEAVDFAPRRGFTPACSEPVESSGCAVRPRPASEGWHGLGVLAWIAAGSLLARRRRPPRARPR